MIQSSTSLPRGNQVDGLPRGCSDERVLRTPSGLNLQPGARILDSNSNFSGAFKLHINWLLCALEKINYFLDILKVLEQLNLQTLGNSTFKAGLEGHKIRKKND